jgi:hypothetical protein
LFFFKWLHNLQAQPTTKTDYKKAAIVVKYMIEIFLNAPIELKVIISFGVLSIIWSLNSHN